MAHTKELVLTEEKTALQVFSIDGGLDPIIQEARAFVADFEHDLSTGRKRTASLANKVAKLKVRLDDMGKAISNIEDLMQAITKLPESEFNDAVTTIAVVAVNTLRETHGTQFIKDFMEAAIADQGGRAILKWQGPQQPTRNH